jgi:hypothetical protein
VVVTCMVTPVDTAVSIRGQRARFKGSCGACIGRLKKPLGWSEIDYRMDPFGTNFDSTTSSPIQLGDLQILLMLFAKSKNYINHREEGHFLAVLL